MKLEYTFELESAENVEDGKNVLYFVDTVTGNGAGIMDDSQSLVDFVRSYWLKNVKITLEGVD